MLDNSVYICYNGGRKVRVGYWFLNNFCEDVKRRMVVEKKTNEEIAAMSEEAFIAFARSVQQVQQGCCRHEDCDECFGGGLIREERDGRVVYKLYQHGFIAKLTVYVHVLPSC